MKLVVNNQEKEFLSSKIEELVEEINISNKFIAVAVNGTVIRRTKWQDVTLKEGDKIDIMSPVGGG